MNSFVVLLAVFRDVPHRSVLLFSLDLNDTFAYLRRIFLVNINSSAPECVDPDPCPDSSVAAPVSEDYYLFYFYFIALMVLKPSLLKMESKIYRHSTETFIVGSAFLKTFSGHHSVLL